MTDQTDLSLGYTDGDIDTNNTGAISLNSLVDQRLSRRQTLRSGASAAAVAVFGGTVLTACDEATTSSDAPPTVTAGSSGATTAGRMVTLTGTASDNGTVGAVAWAQTGGPTVTLSSPNANTTTFLAPSVAEPTTLTFRFTAADENAQTTSATTTVTVSPAVLGFTAVPKNRNDIVTVPEGYTVTVMTALGDPLAAGVPAFRNDGSDTDYANRIGDHGDALYWYGLSSSGTRDDNSSTRGLLVQNHENLNVQYLHPAGPTAPGGVRPEAEAIKEIEAHGVSVTEYRRTNGAWAYVQDSAFNRRITPNTPTVLHGPVRGTSWVVTAYSPTGVAGRGTINNCANGHTPWGTNLTCEENWAGYFRRSGDDALRSAKELTSLRRYGVTSSSGNYLWSTVTPADASSTIFRKWDARATAGTPTSDFRNEPFQYGWVVEHDPYDKNAAPRKRTALGRMGHEGAWLSRAEAGKKLAVYMGDDSRGEYFYKYVSNASWDAADATSANRLAMGDKYLDQGTLHVARFNADGTGQWLPLTFGQVPNRPAAGADPEYVFADQADILVNARLAADAVGATGMDRPEWTATNMVNGEVYLTLTNNNATVRPLNGTNAANPRHYNDPKGTSAQRGNPNGHIIRIRENGDDPAAAGFTWDIYLFGAGSDLDPNNINVSGLTAGNDFSSPDGIWFSRPTNPAGLVNPVLWIQTDDGAYTDVTNNQMLAAMPGRVGDGGARTITNTGANGATATQATRVGKPATDATVKRFLIGPVECEITGVDSTPDGRTLFVGIQHPGEDGTPAAPTSNWPANQNGAAPAGTRPRSAVVAITKNDGGVIAL
ncbi:PhoX family protein [Sphingosinithalassobacter sp. CS137]|uniref:PhoX family protein n=1 Tax=Sphingosinithalassobacter sp. CS137 TaxID=2762748 RepID=UPI00165D60D8|nr:PhoX family phosphatase [Sphingosinithalassobacter sp. CS137]